tara:strand:- start:753 stop:1682 length:930 start_codon:yes stop_codon:yes gene_type:complete
MSRRFRIGTRESRLALAQSRLLGELASRHNPDVVFDYVGIKTEGDLSNIPLAEHENPGVFVSQLREELVAGHVDLIIHSMKDLPAMADERLLVACVPAREAHQDVLISRAGTPLLDISSGGLIGTSSPRRAASIRRLRPDLRVESIRGNIDTRIDKVMGGEFEGTVLALAGLKRAGLTDVITELLPVEQFLPAPRQGTLAVECRNDDEIIPEIFCGLDNPEARIVSQAETSLLSGLRAGCGTAVGALASLDDGQLKMTAELASAETGEFLRIDKSCPEQNPSINDADDLGRAVAEEFRAHEIYSKAGLS